MFKRLIRSETFRQRTVWVVAAVLILPFILFFSSSTPVNGPGADEAGRLFGRPVPWDAFRQQRVWVRRQVAALIQETPAFQVEGRFDPERYRQFLKATGTNPQVFEASLREDLILQ